MSIENVVTGGFGWKHALAILGLAVIGASLYRRNALGLSSMADKITGTITNVTG